MITPTKYMNIELSVLAVSGTILETLACNEIMTYEELLIYLKNKKGRKVVENFTYALTFLFAINKIIYHKHLDSFEILL